ncbi:MAG: rhomboid family intramembrane serine protease [Gammaproteobacteria bacterium]
MSIDHAIRRDWWGWYLQVDEAAVTQASQQIDLYEQENQAPPALTGISPRGGGVRLGMLGYATVLLSVFALQGGFRYGIDWTSAGRVDVAAIYAGEYWRLITALTLHSDLWHLLGNLGFGALFALFLSRQLGGGVTWLAILIAGALGNAMNALVQPPEHLAVGASTAVFAALGLLAAFYFFFGRLHRNSWARRWAPIIGGLWVLTWLGTGDENTDIVAHLTGFLAGLLLGSLMGKIPKPSKHESVVQAAAGLLAVCGILGSWVLAVR